VDLLIKPVDVDMNCRMVYSETAFENLEEKSRVKFIKRLMSNFDLRLNDIKIKTDEPSDKLFNFSKVYGPCFFNSWLGLEEANFRIRNPIDNNQVDELYSKFSEIVFTENFKLVTFNIREHCASLGNLEEYLKNLVPKIPGLRAPFRGRSQDARYYRPAKG
jgi:hypothetical protein